MTKQALKKCYELYLGRHPEKRKMEYLLNFYDEIPKQYFDPEQVEEWEQLPDIVSGKEVKKLNKKYKGELKWRLIDTSVTEEKLTEFEKENNIKLPNQVREFLKGYAFPLWEVYLQALSDDEYEYTYSLEKDDYEILFDEGECIEEENSYDYYSERIALFPFEFPFLYYGWELETLKRYDDDTWKQCLEFGYIYLQDFGAFELYLDCVEKNIIAVDHEEWFNLEAETREEFLEDGGDELFRNFDHYIRCLLGLEVLKRY